MIRINEDKHPELHRYSRELRKYPKLTDEQYNQIIFELAHKDFDMQNKAMQKLICHHLEMILFMAKKYSYSHFIEMEDFVGIGNLVMVENAKKFNPNKNVQFSSYMRKVVTHSFFAEMRKQNKWNPENQISDIDLIGTWDIPTNKYNFVHKVIATLTEFEQKVINFTFFDNFNADEKEIARTLNITIYRLRYTKKLIYEKLRPLLSEKKHISYEKVYYVGGSENLEPEDNNEN